MAEAGLEAWDGQTQECGLYHHVHLSHDSAPAMELNIPGQMLLRDQKWPRGAVHDLGKSSVRAAMGQSQLVVVKVAEGNEGM